MEWVWRPAVRSRIMAAKVPSSLLLETTPVSTTHHTLPPSSWLLRAPAPDSLSAPGTQRSWETLPVKKGRRELGEQMATCQSPHFPFCVSVSVCMTPSSLLYSQNQAQCPEHSRCSVSEGQVPQLCPTLWDPKDYTFHGILQARIQEWVAFPFSRGSSQPMDRTQVSHITGRFFTSWATREAQRYWSR